MDSRPGLGTTFTLTLPVTVATTQCLLVRAGGQTFGLPLSGVGRILRLRPQDAAQNQGRRVVLIDDEPVVVTSLAALLGIDREDAPWTDVRPAVLLYASERRVAVLVDGVLGSPEVVVKNLPEPLVRVPGVGGATILGSGETILVLSAADLVKAATGASRAATGKRAPPERRRPRPPRPGPGLPSWWSPTTRWSPGCSRRECWRPRATRSARPPTAWRRGRSSPRVGARCWCRT